jgi:hypothetical protein
MPIPPAIAPRRPSRLALLVAGVAFLSCSPLADESLAAFDRKRFEALAKRFFEARPKTAFDAWDAELRSRLLEEARQLGAAEDFVLADVVKTLEDAGRKSVAPFRKDRFATPYGEAWFLRKPPASAKDQGLVIGLHGGGEGAGNAEDATSFHRKDCLGFYPQGIRLVHDTWNTVHGENFVLTLIERAKLHDRVDPNRVYVTGFSMGGTGAWFFAGRHPDLFAAAAPGPGVIMASPKSQLKTKEEVEALQHGVLPNVRNLPVSFYVGLEDRNTMPGTYLYAWDRLLELKASDPEGYLGVEFRTFETLAHEFPPGEPRLSLDWLGQHRREPWPKQLVWEYASDPFPQPTPEEPLPRRVKEQFYWLACAEPPDNMRVVAKRDGNVFELTIARADPASFRVLLRDELIDPQGDLVLRVDGKEVARGMPRRDLGLVLETFDRYLDRDLTFDRALAP